MFVISRYTTFLISCRVGVSPRVCLVISRVGLRPPYIIIDMTL
ncbi:hypothetical protein NTHI1209_01332 [Haemophilus influenzae]|uniref:Uncharacterized protein n=1 Tax=Haemophilus influenzae TaxID=727 RepID=A0A158SXY0_HAEIF|nr:hypothetical protein NTHI1209_01332 [Haemophilus influenzae]